VGKRPCSVTGENACSYACRSHKFVGFINDKASFKEEARLSTEIGLSSPELLCWLHGTDLCVVSESGCSRIAGDMRKICVILRPVKSKMIYKCAAKWPKFMP